MMLHNGINDVLANDKGRRGSWRRSIAHMNHAIGMNKPKVIYEPALTVERLCANSGTPDN
jgi:hypothetical protein